MNKNATNTAAIYLLEIFEQYIMHQINISMHNKVNFFNDSMRKTSLYIQGVLLPDRQTLRGDSRHEDKYY